MPTREGAGALVGALSASAQAAYLLCVAVDRVEAVHLLQRAAHVPGLHHDVLRAQSTTPPPRAHSGEFPRTWALNPP